jgi:outer membrane autotransporter protein
MSIGRINVGGDFTQTSTGVLEIEGSIVTDVADRLNVGGRATLSGTLAVRPESRPFGIATEYTVLEAAGGVTGTFDTTTSTESDLDTSVDYLPTSVKVALVRNDISFERMAGSGHLQTFGSVLDTSKRSMARGDFKAVMDEFVAMDPTAQESALRSLSGEMHASLPSTLLRTGERFFSASATRRVNAEQSGERVTMWTDYVRLNGDVRGSGGASGVTYGVSGLVGGVDFAIGRVARLGGSLGFARTRSDLQRFSSDGAVVRSRMPAVYGQYAAGPVLVEGSFGYGEHIVRTARLIELGAVRRQALANYTADQYSGLVRISVAVPVRRGLAVAPFLETRHSQITRRGFDETGAGSVNLTGVEALQAQSLRTLVGLRTTSASRLFGARVEPLFSLAWTREGMDRLSGMQAALTGMTTRPGFQTFTLNGAPDARNGALINAGGSVVVASHGRAFVAYDGLLTEMRKEHSIAAGLRMVW